MVTSNRNHTNIEPLLIAKYSFLDMIAFLFLVGILTLVFSFLKWTYSHWDRRGFKTLPGFYYFTGHFKLDFGRKSFAEVASRLYDCTEPFAGIYFLFSPKLLLRNPNLIRSILIKDFSHFTDRGVQSNEELEPLSGHLFGLGGAKWKNLRTKLSPTFTSGKLKAMFPTVVGCGSTLQSYLNRFVEKGDSLDVLEISANYATNVIASVAFGIEIDSINNPNNDFRMCGRDITRPSLFVGLKRLLIIFAPKLATIFILRFDGIKVENFIMSMVKQNLEYRERNNVVRKDFFQLLIQLRNSGTVQLDDEWNTVIKANESEKMMTLNQISAQCFIFFLAGFETSSSTLTFCLYELAKNQNIQRRVHDEIDKALAKHDGRISYESSSEMNFLDSCIDETLRMYPVLPILSRQCVEKYRIPGTDKFIEKGVEVIIPVYGLHRDSKYYNEPDKFDPDRFIDHPVGKDQVNHPFLSFGDGPRNCIGMRLGKLQTKVGLVSMLQKHRYELDRRNVNRGIEYDPKSFLLTPKGGLNLKILKR